MQSYIYLEFIKIDITVTLNLWINVMIPLKSFLIPGSKEFAFVPASIASSNPAGVALKVWELFNIAPTAKKNRKLTPILTFDRVTYQFD